MALIGFLGGGVLGFLAGLVGWLGFDLTLISAIGLYLAVSVLIGATGILLALRGGSDRPTPYTTRDLRTA